MLFNVGTEEFSSINLNLIKLHLLKYINEKYNCKIKNTIIEITDDYDYAYSNNVNLNFNEILFDYMDIDLDYLDINNDNSDLLNINRQYLTIKRFFVEYQYSDYNLANIDEDDLDSIFSDFFIKTVIFSNPYINTIINDKLFNNKFRKLLKKLNTELKAIYEIDIGSFCCELDYIKIRCVKNLGICCYLPICFTPTIELIDCFMELINLSKIILKKRKKGGNVEI